MRTLFATGHSPAGADYMEVAVPTKRRIEWSHNVRIGSAHMVHRQHPNEAGQTACGRIHPTTHAGLRPTTDPVTCPLCLKPGQGRAA